MFPVFLILLNPGRAPYRSRRTSMTMIDHGRPSIQNREEMDAAREKSKAERMKSQH